MSRVLEAFPDQPKRVYVLPKYRWDIWFDGRVHALTPDEYGDSTTFRNSAHRVALRKGFRLRTVMIAGEFVLQATYRQEEEDHEHA